jgi:hypothetical protein
VTASTLDTGVPVGNLTNVVGLSKKGNPVLAYFPNNCLWAILDRTVIDDLNLHFICSGVLFEDASKRLF